MRDAWASSPPLLPLFLAVLTSLTIPALQGYFDKPGTFGITDSSNYFSVVYFSAFVVISVCVYSVVDTRPVESPVDTVPRSWSVARARFGWDVAVVVAIFSSRSSRHCSGWSGPIPQRPVSCTVALAGQGVFVWLLLTPAAASLVYMSAN